MAGHSSVRDLAAARCLAGTAPGGGDLLTPIGVESGMSENRYFFSYSRDDGEFVLRLARDLRAAGVTVWIDQDDIAAGERWDEEIEEALKESAHMIVVLSPTSVASDNVMDEVSYALEKKKRVVPIMYRECEVPFRLRRLQHVSFLGDYDQALADLLEDLRPAPTAAESPAAATAAGAVEPAGETVPPSGAAGRDPGPAPGGRGQRSKMLWIVPLVAAAVVAGIYVGGRGKGKGGSRPDVVVAPPPDKLELKPGLLAAAGKLKEDCLTVDAGQLRVLAAGRRWQLTSGSGLIQTFDDRREAEQAQSIIRHYGFDQHCFVGRPNPSLEYWLAGGAAPFGAIRDEDCIGFGRLVNKDTGGSWTLYYQMNRFPDREEADQALAVIKRYGFRQTCFVGRPDPSMSYLRK